jgi:hypothetical protein
LAKIAENCDHNIDPRLLADPSPFESLKSYIEKSATYFFLKDGNEFISDEFSFVFTAKAFFKKFVKMESSEDMLG